RRPAASPCRERRRRRMPRHATRSDGVSVRRGCLRGTCDSLVSSPAVAGEGDREAVEGARPREPPPPRSLRSLGTSPATAGEENVLLPQRIQRLLEAAGVGLLGLGQRREPVRACVEAFGARGLRHAGIQVGVFVRLAGDRGLEVQRGAADRFAGRRIADRLEIFEMAMGVAGLAFGGRAEHGGDIVVAFDVGLLREVEIAPVGLALAGEGVLQILRGLGSFKCGHGGLLVASYRCVPKPSAPALSIDWNSSKETIFPLRSQPLARMRSMPVWEVAEAPSGAQAGGGNLSAAVPGPRRRSARPPGPPAVPARPRPRCARSKCRSEAPLPRRSNAGDLRYWCRNR